MTPIPTRYIRDGRSQERRILIQHGESSKTLTTDRIGLPLPVSRRTRMAALLALLALCGIAGPLMPTANAAACGAMAFNPVTGKLDCVGLTIPLNGSVGQCLQVTSVSPFTVGWATCGTTPVSNILLLEDGSFFLLEDGTDLLLES